MDGDGMIMFSYFSFIEKHLILANIGTMSGDYSVFCSFSSANVLM